MAISRIWFEQSYCLLSAEETIWSTTNTSDVYLEFVRDLPDVVEIQVLQNLDFRELVQFIEVGGGDEVAMGGFGTLGGGPCGGGVLQAEGCQGRKARIHLAARRRQSASEKCLSLSISAEIVSILTLAETMGRGEITDG